jgi:hypothetical protein
MFYRIVQSGLAVRGVVKLPLASEFYDADQNWERTGRQAPVAHRRSTGLDLNPSVDSPAEQ